MGAQPDSVRGGPQERGLHAASEGVRPWRVLHVCESAWNVWPVVEGQLAAGMRPSVVTPHGYRVVVDASEPPRDRPRPLSLMGAWHEVRNWRASMLEAGIATAAEVVHAHTFASGMAAVRNCPVVVYDLCTFVEEQAAQHALPERRSWLDRSFRVAEQFIVTRAGAVVVHSSTMRERAVGRGAPPDHTFMIPSPLELEHDDELVLPRDHGNAAVFFAAGVRALTREISAGVLALLRTAAVLCDQCPGVRVLIEASPEAAPGVVEAAQQLGIAGCLEILAPGQAETAMERCDVVIAGGDEERGGVLALQYGRSLLAPDTPALRDVSADGQGCLWYDPNDAGDLARRAAFLARNPHFRRALGSAGRAHLRATRSPAAVGRRYDEVYRHALKRRGSANGVSPSASLLPIHACI